MVSESYTSRSHSTGDIYTADLQFANYTVDDQAFCTCPANILPLFLLLLRFTVAPYWKHITLGLIC